MGGRLVGWAHTGASDHIQTAAQHAREPSGTAAEPSGSLRGL
jgi:hypothetical protein